MIALVLTLSSCSGNSTEESTEKETPTQAVASKKPPPSPEPEKSPEPDPSLKPTASPEPGGSAPLDLLVSQTNASLDGVAAQLAGTFSVYCEARGTGTMAIIFRAENKMYESPEIIKPVAEQVGPVYSTLPQGMLAMGITDPKVALEFLDMNGALIHSQEFTLDGTSDVGESMTVFSSEEALRAFVETQKATATEIEKQFEGYAKVSIEARGSNTLAYVFKVTEFNVGAGMTESLIRSTVLPTFESGFESMLPMLSAMGVIDPVIVFEFYAPDGSLIGSTEVK